MFTYDPKARFSARQCLSHDYFISTPLPATGLRLSEIDEIHGFEAMKQTQTEKPTAPSWQPKKRRAREYDENDNFKRGRSKFFENKRRRYNYREYEAEKRTKEVKSKMPKTNVLPFFMNIDIVPELADVEDDCSTADFLNPQRLSNLGFISLPTMESPSVENNLFF